MSYLGQSQSVYDPTRSQPNSPDVFSGNGSQVTFNLTRSIGVSTDIIVMVENVVQQPDYAYTATGSLLTFSAAPGAGTNNIYVIYERVTGLNTAIPDGSITSSKLANNIRLLTTDQYTGTGSQTTFGLSDTPYDANSLFVSVNGVVQSPPTNYTVSGNTIIFTSAPNSGANVVVRNVGFRTTQTLYALTPNTPIAQPNITGGIVNLSTGTLTVPVGTTAQRPSPVANGSIRYNTTTSSFEGYGASGWAGIGGGGGAKGGGSDAVFYENGQTVTTSYTLSANTNAMSAGPITINSSATVTIPDGQSWTILG